MAFWRGLLTETHLMSHCCLLHEHKPNQVSTTMTLELQSGASLNIAYTKQLAAHPAAYLLSSVHRNGMGYIIPHPYIIFCCR